MTPPQSRSTTRKEESDSDMDEVNMADDMSSTSSEATFSFVPGTMSPMPSENGRKSSRFKAKGPKMPTINVSHVKNSPHMVFFLGNGKEPLGQSDGQETFYKTPIREAGIAFEKGKACTSHSCERNCRNCEAYRKEIEIKNAKLVKTKEKKRILEGQFNDLFAKYTHSEESNQQKIEELSKHIELLTEQNKEFQCKLIMAGCKVAEKNHTQEETLRREKEELAEKMRNENEAHAIEMQRLRAKFGAYGQQLLQRTENEKISLVNQVSMLQEQLHASKEREECAAKMNETLQTESEVLNLTVDSLKEEGEKQDDTLASSARRSRNQRKVMEGLRNRNDELEDENATLRTQLNEERTQLATQRQRSNNLRINNALLQNLVDMFYTRLDASEGREEENRVLHEELRQMLNNLQFPRRPADQVPNEQVIHDVLLPQHPVFSLSDDQVDITVLHCQIVSDVHIPD